MNFNLWGRMHLNLKKLAPLQRNKIILALFFFFISQVLLAATEEQIKDSKTIIGYPDKIFSSQNRYQPYFEVGGAKYFNQTSSVAGIYDLFIPLCQQRDDQLLFTDLRIFDRSGSSFEGNAHFGYRKLYPDAKQMFGVYAAFDRKRSNLGNNYNQITLGFEYWQNNWFVGGNVYKPIGVTKRYIGEAETAELRNTGRSITEIKTTNMYYEKSLPGADAQLGYSFTESLTGYLGGYYFHANDASSVVGPKISVAYNYNQPHGRILGVLDGVSVEKLGRNMISPEGIAPILGLSLKLG